MAYSLLSGLKQTLIIPPANKDLSLQTIHSDFLIRFHAARNLPKKDMIGSADPYFHAKIDDDQVEFISACIVNTLNPIWNEDWIVRNVPLNGKLFVTIYDKDDEKITDDYIGKFQIDLQPMENQLINILGPCHISRGQFLLSIFSIPISADALKLRPYTFDGPVRYSRHNSQTVGRLTKINDERLYSTWEISLKRIDIYFDRNEKQKYNSSYQAAKSIFEGPMSHAIQSTIQQAHRIFYAKHTFFLDFASKHALHSNCARTVFYAGEFHPRPKGGYNEYDLEDIRSWNQWELVIDNGSGTYAPDLKRLEKLKDLFICNFPQLNLLTYDYKDQQLKVSIEACRNFANSPKSKSIKTLKYLVLSSLNN